MKMLNAIYRIVIFILTSLLINTLLISSPAYCTEKKSPPSLEEQDRMAELTMLSLQYGNRWSSIPSDNDIAKAIEAYPKIKKYDDKYLGKPSYSETVETFKLGKVLKKHAVLLVEKIPREANNIFVECTFNRTTIYYSYNIATGKTTSDTYTSEERGYLKLEQTPEGTFTFGDGDGTNEIVKSFAGSDGVLLYADGWIQVKSDKYRLYGQIMDANGKPMPYIQCLIMVNGKEEQVIADFQGKYEYFFTPANPLNEQSKKVRMRIVFRNLKDSKEYFRMSLFTPPAQAPDYIMAVINFSIDETKQELQKDINFGTADQGFVSSTGTAPDPVISNIGQSIEKLKNYSVVYRNNCDALKFAMENLKVDFGNNIPLKIKVDTNEDYSAYASDTNTIRIKSESTLNLDVSRWVQFHEFGHYTQYTAYGNRWPSGAYVTGDPRNSNHGGYVNDETGDSFVEGFASYFSCLVQKYGDNPMEKPETLGDLGSLEFPWVPWENEGKREEFAFSAVLWDLTFKVGIPYTEMWDVLKKDRETFYMYYDAFIKKYPSKKNLIDSRYMIHGIYSIPLEGNHRYDEGEAYADTDKDGKYDEGEYFIDYSMDPQTGKMYMGMTEGSVMGQSSNYERVDKRYSTYRFPNSYLRVKGNSEDTVKVVVNYLDGSYSCEYAAPVVDGRVHISTLPESLQAEVLVLPASSASDGTPYYKATSAQLLEKLKASRDSDSFDIIDIGSSKEADSKQNSPSDSKSNFIMLLLYGALCLLFLFLGYISLSKNKTAAVIIIILAFAALIVSSTYFFKLREQKDKKTDSTEVSTPPLRVTASPSAAPNFTPAPTLKLEPSAGPTPEESRIEAGRLNYPSGELYYEGQIKNGKPNGRGTVYYESGKVWYEGYLIDGKAYGKGILYSEEGKKMYEGDFKNASYDGKGKIYYKEGSVYEGEVANNLPEGLGTCLWSNGDKYTGEWKNGIMEGSGVCTTSDGTIFHDGLWEKGKPVK